VIVAFVVTFRFSFGNSREVVPSGRLYRASTIWMHNALKAKSLTFLLVAAQERKKCGLNEGVKVQVVGYNFCSVREVWCSDTLWNLIVF
jgi:hypothetical protein